MAGDQQSGLSKRNDTTKHGTPALLVFIGTSGMVGAALTHHFGAYSIVMLTFGLIFASSFGLEWMTSDIQGEGDLQ